MLHAVLLPDAPDLYVCGYIGAVYAMSPEGDPSQVLFHTLDVWQKVGGTYCYLRGFRADSIEDCMMEWLAWYDCQREVRPLC